MIKIVTALGNPNLNNELKKYNEFEVVCKDIQYVDGIIEILEINSDIDYIILSEMLEGQVNIEQLINKIININRRIKIIPIIDKKNTELENQLLSKGVYDILYDGVDIFNIINLLKNKNIEIINKELKAEIDNLKKIILNNKIEKNNILNKIKGSNKKNNNLKNENHNGKIITIAGNRGIGKTTFSIVISNIIKKNKKVLLVDFDVINNDITNIFKVKNIKKSKLQNNIIKINENFYILGNISYLYYNKKIKINNIIDNIEKIKQNYDYIIIDIYSELIFELNKFIFYKSDSILFLTQMNKLEIQKTQKMIKFISEIWKINFKKIYLVIYKYKIFDFIFFNKLNLKTLFKNIKIIGKIRYNLFFNILFNLNLNKVFLGIKNRFYYSKILKSIDKEEWLNG